MASKAFNGRGGILDALDSTLRAPARAIGRKTMGREFAGLPRRAFWVKVGPGRDDKGAPTYTKVGSDRASRMITMITARGLPDKPVRTWDDLALHLVPRETLEKLDMLHGITAGWDEEWNAQPAPEPAAETTAETASDTSEPSAEPEATLAEEENQEDDISY